jgi:RHS repeat-associated protein
MTVVGAPGLNANAGVVHALMQARYQNSSRGQFISEDPVFLGDPRQQQLTDPQTLNSYSYANDNPITNSDPLGKFVELSGSLVAPGRAWSAGIRFDANGIDYFFSGGTGIGLEAGFEAMWAPGVALPHRTQAAVTANGTYADGFGGRISQNIWTYDPQTKKTVPNGDPTLGLVLGAGSGASVQLEGSGPIPFLVWNPPASPSVGTLNFSTSVSNYGSASQYVVRNNTTYVRTSSGGLSATSLPATVTQGGTTYYRNSSGLLSATPQK